MGTENFPAWQLRVIEEKAALDIKIAHLFAFLEKGNPDDMEPGEWRRLCAQYEIMRCYSGILGERIANFTQ